MANTIQNKKLACYSTVLDTLPARQIRRRKLFWGVSRAAIVGCAWLLLGEAAPAQVAETINYSYDALGRLTNVAHSGSVNNGVTAAYTLDAAGNRSNVTVTTSASAAPSFAVSDSTATEGGQLGFIITKTGTTTGTYSVNFATADNTAVAGSDYTAQSGTATFGPTDTSVAVRPFTNNDGIVEGTETMFLNLSAPTGGSTITRAQAVGTILDTGAPPAPAFKISDPTVTEGGTLDFVVSRTGSTAGTNTVTYTTADGTATAGSDYTATTGTLTFTPGQNAWDVSVSTIDDSAVEGSETVLVNLANATGGATIADSQGVGTIIDNDGTPPPSFSINSVQATEGGTLAFTVTRTGATTGTYTVNYASANGTATAGSDYNGVSGTLSFGPGVTTLPINVTTIDDTLVEETEAMSVGLSSASGGATITTATGTGTILDNDTASGPVTINLSSGGSANLRSLANSSGYTGTTGVTYNFVVPNGVTITGSAGGGTAITTGTWPTGVTLTLSIAGTVSGGGGTGGAGGPGVPPRNGSGGGTGGDGVSCSAPIAISVSGALLAGGGGGGGAGGTLTGIDGTHNTGGGGGGGGAPNGAGGAGGSSTTGPGQSGFAGSPGSGGSGGFSGDTEDNGGDGGGPGLAGTPGTAPSLNGTGGAAGFAVRKNGTTCTASGNITGTVG